MAQNCYQWVCGYGALLGTSENEPKRKSDDPAWIMFDFLVILNILSQIQVLESALMALLQIRTHPPGKAAERWF